MSKLEVSLQFLSKLNVVVMLFNFKLFPVIDNLLVPKIIKLVVVIFQGHVDTLYSNWVQKFIRVRNELVHVSLYGDDLHHAREIDFLSKLFNCLFSVMELKYYFLEPVKLFVFL